MRTFKKLLLLAALLLIVFVVYAQEPNAVKEERSMEGVKVLFVLSGHPVKGSTGKPTGWYLSEAAHPWKVLHDEGIEVDFMSPKGGRPSVDGFNLEDPVNKEFWENPEVQKLLENTYTPDQIKSAIMQPFTSWEDMVPCGISPTMNK